MGMATPLFHWGEINNVHRLGPGDWIVPNDYFLGLKVLFNEMYLKAVSIDRSSLKGEAQRFLGKILLYLV